MTITVLVLTSLVVQCVMSSQIHSPTFRCQTTNLAKPLETKREFRVNKHADICGLCLKTKEKQYEGIYNIYQTFCCAMTVVLSCHIQQPAFSRVLGEHHTHFATSGREHNIKSWGKKTKQNSKLCKIEEQVKNVAGQGEVVSLSNSSPPDPA